MYLISNVTSREGKTAQIQKEGISYSTVFLNFFIFLFYFVFYCTSLPDAANDLDISV